MGKAAAAYNRCGFGFYYAASGSTSNAFYANLDSSPGGFKLFGSGQFLVESTISATSPSTGSLTTPGGMSCGGDFWVGGNSYFGFSNAFTYQEGTWTPTLGVAGGSCTFTYGSARSGKYVKCGKQCTINFRINFGYSVNAGTLFVIINNCPFALSSSTAASASVDYVYTSLNMPFAGPPYTINYQNICGLPYDGYLYIGVFVSSAPTIYKTSALGTGNTEYIAGSLTFMTT